MSFLKENKFGFLLIFVVFLVGVLSVIYVPNWKGPEILSSSYALFGLSLSALFLIYWIAGFLFRRWKITGKQNKTTHIWAWSFIIFSFSFIGILLQSLGISWADSGNPLIFFIFRQSMILFIIGIYKGLVEILEIPSFWKKQFPIILLFVLYAGFVYSLLILQNVELTMFWFLSFFFVPICFLIALFFNDYARKENLNAMRILGGGFAFLGLTYLGWAPWHRNYFYVLMFFLFVFSLVVILVGLIYLSFEKDKIPKKNETKEKISPKLKKVVSVNKSTGLKSENK